MNKLNQQVEHISKLLPKITRNLRVASLIDKVKPGLTTSQLMVLLILKDIKETALPMGKLAQELVVSFPTVSGIIDRLYKEKLVERVRSEQDRRLVLVKLTDSGREIIEKLLKNFEDLLLTILKEMSVSEQKSMIKSIKSVFTFSTILSNKNISGTN